MAKKILYRSNIIENEEAKEIMVDIFNLPYDRFSKETPLFIREDVTIKRSQGNEVPSMRHVVITGALNIKDISITPDTILPDELTELICQHSINSLADLPKKLPAKLKKITIRHALMNNIKNDKNGALLDARRFVQAHPRIIVTDEKTTLRDLLKEIDKKHTNDKTQKDTESSTQPTINTVETKDKTDEYYSTDELVAMCRNASPELEALTDAELSRYIKKARSTKANLKLDPIELKRDDGAKVICVHKKHLDTIIDYILSQIESDQMRIQARKTVRKTKKTSQDTTESEKDDKVTYYQIDGKKITATQIKKYITKSKWNAICSACRNNKKQLLKILKDIDAININPSDTAKNKVYYIQDDTIKTSRTIEFKSAKCLTQGFNSQNSRQRIIWAVSGNTFVCVDFFAEHEHSIDKYKNVIRGIDIDLSTIEPESLFDVSDLIRDLSSDDPNRPTQTDTDPEPTTEDTTTQNTNSANADFKKKNDLFTNFVWPELFSMNTRLTQHIKFADSECKILLNKMLVETSTEKLLHMTKDVFNILQRKKLYEEAQAKLSSINNQLQELQKGSMK